MSPLPNPAPGEAAHFQRHTPADPQALPGQIAQARQQLAAASSANDTPQLLDHAGTLIALLTAARQEAEAHALGTQYVPLAGRHPDLEESAWLLHAQATAAQYIGLRAEANGLFAEALHLCCTHHWRRLEHFVLHHWGRSRVEEGDFAAAQQCFEASLAIRWAMDDAPMVASSRRALAALAALTGDAGPAP